MTLANRYKFEPVAVETTGLLGGSTFLFHSRLGRRISALTGDDRMIRMLFERISLAESRSNASLLYATGATHPAARISKV